MPTELNDDSLIWSRLNEILFEIAANKRCFVHLKHCIQTVTCVKKRGLMGSAPAAFADKFVYERRGALHAWRHACGGKAPQSSGGSRRNVRPGRCFPRNIFLSRTAYFMRLRLSANYHSFIRCAGKTDMCCKNSWPIVRSKYAECADGA